MRWKKLGKIFDPTEHRLPNNCTEFAQSPQALVFDDFVRIYFCSREVDDSGKYLSHIAFVDMDKSFNEILRVSSKPVVPLGSLGCFDEHGIFPLNVLQVGKQIYGYTTGWHRKVSVSVDGAIGFVVSEDGGETFERLGDGPILAPSLNEPFMVADAFVQVYGDRYHMWYIHGTQWIKSGEFTVPERVYKIAHATSDDGVSWHKERRLIIEDRLGSNECQALPTVICHQGLYHMYFCYRQAFGFREDKTRGYRIGYAVSRDLINWERSDARAGIDVSEKDWDSDMMCYPHVFKHEGKVFMLYNGNQFGRFGFGLAVLEN